MAHMELLTSKKERLLGRIAARIVPETAELDDAGRRRFTEIIDGALGDRPPGVRRQFATFLGVLDWAPVLRYGRRFAALAPRRQDAVLRWFEDCPVALPRKGFWGLKAMVFMGYYGQPEVHRLIGYAPDFDGRTGLHARA